MNLIGPAGINLILSGSVKRISTLNSKIWCGHSHDFVTFLTKYLCADNEVLKSEKEKDFPKDLRKLARMMYPHR